MGFSTDKENIVCASVGDVAGIAAMGTGIGIPVLGHLALGILMQYAAGLFRCGYGWHCPLKGMK